MTRPGTTLVELVVTIAILGALAAVATLAIARIGAPPDDLRSALERARTQAAERGTAVRLTRVEQGRFLDLIAFPDGRIVADTSYHVEPLTGRAERAAP